ncbi:MAG: Acyl carrier protein [Candidatus Heimdallarchaeota archaeon AB_125]|nr:MAG: Acyl carrier protein [Candidatus Heimdallarchaeota archaeon AB_125]
MYSSILTRLRLIIAEVAEVRSHVITTNTYFEDDLNLDKDGLKELRARLEDEFDIKLPKTVFKEFNTVGEIVGFIEAEMGR